MSAADQNTRIYLARVMANPLTDDATIDDAQFIKRACENWRVLAPGAGSRYRVTKGAGARIASAIDHLFTQCGR